MLAGKGWRLGRCMFVGDAGLNSEENGRELALGNGKYILGSRLRAGARVLQTTEVREEAAALLNELGVPPPPRFHAIEPTPET